MKGMKVLAAFLAGVFLLSPVFSVHAGEIRSCDAQAPAGAGMSSALASAACGEWVAGLAEQGFRCIGTKTSAGELQRCIGRIPGYSREVALLIPPGFQPAGRDGDKPEILLYLHGHNISPQKTLEQMLDEPEKHLEETFAASGRNAIFVVPHSVQRCNEFNAELAPAGKAGAFLSSVAATAADAGLLPGGEASSVSLVGHSGAYLPISTILAQSSAQNSWAPKIREVILLDSTYGRADVYSAWVKADSSHRFWSAYIPGSPTEGQSVAIQQSLAAAHPPISFRRPVGYGASPDEVRASRVGFVHSQVAHAPTVGAYLPLLLSR